MKRSIYFVLAMLCFGKGYAQDKFGAVNSNYSPTNSVHLNPSSMLDAKTWLDIHIVGFGAYVNNNYAAIENESWLNVFRQRQIDENQILYNINRNKYHVYNRNDVSVLSAVLSQGDHAFGISFNAFSYTDLRKLDNSIVVPVTQLIQDNNVDNILDLDVKGLRANSSAYGEAKLSYAYIFQKRSRELLMFGVSVKKIFPIVGGGAKVSEANYNLLTNNGLEINRFIGDLMYNVTPEFTMRGGMGLDLGFTYQRMKDGSRSYYPNTSKGGCSPKYYDYKIGVSIIDIGTIRYNESTSNIYAVDIENLQIAPNENIENVLNSISTEDVGAIKKPYKIGLPTVFSLQADYNIWRNMVYLNGTIVQGIPPFSNRFSVRRANSLSITPRFETKWFDLAVPFSIYEYRQAQLGLSLRLYNLTIGTDKFLGILVPSNLYGADVYAQLKVPLYRNPKCKSRGGYSGNKKGKRGKNKKGICDAYH